MLAVVTALVGVLAAAPAAPDEVRKHVDSILADSDYQKEMPFAKKGKATEWKVPSQRGSDSKTRKKSKARDADYEAGGFAQFAQLLMYMLMIAGLIALIFWAFTEFSGYWKDKPLDDGDGAIGSVDEGVITRPLGDAEALARQGKFDEAIHVLLLQTLGELSARLDNPLPDALTSREILEHVPVPDDARLALSGLITSVEVTHFGDQVPGEADYQRCLGSFQQFAAAYRRGGA